MYVDYVLVVVCVGKYIFVEKLLVVLMEDVEVMVFVVKEVGVYLIVGLSYSFDLLVELVM